MAVETITIDIVSNYKDGMSPNIDTSKQKIDKMEQSMQKMQKQIASLTKDKATVKVEAQDKATSKLEKVGNLVKTLGKKALKLPVTVIDKATKPLRSILNYATSIKGIITGIAGGMALNKIVMEPIGLADAYSSAKIGFSTLLGESGGNKLMNQIDQFAKATPFKTSNTIEQAQRMIAMGWDAEGLIDDMKVIGDAAAATGKGDEGLQRIVTALAQIKSKGKLSTEELNQLAEAGISAKRYIAEGLGYGSGDKGLAAMAADLQKGKVGAEAAIQAIMQGMQEYNGMMEKTANETVEGLKSQIEDTFEINIFRKWGQGLQDGAKKGLGSVIELLNASEDSLSAFGDQLQDIGSDISNFAADKLENVIDKILEISERSDFKNADLGGKFKIMWDEVIAQPFGEWWDSTGQPWMVQKMTGLGEGLGSGLSNIFKGLLGFNSGDVVDDAATIGGGFAKGFLEGFDGSGVWKALTESIKNAFSDALKAVTGQGDGSSWASAALLGYGGFKLLQGANSVSALFGGPTAGGLLGKGIGKLGTSLYGGMASSMPFGAAALPASSQMALGLGAGAGYLVGGATLISGAKDIYHGFKSEDAKEKSAYGKSGMWKMGGVAAGAATGAAIGSVIPGVGTVIGAGVGALVGGVGGWWKGNQEVEKYNKSLEETAEKEKKAKIEIEQRKYATQEMKDAVAALHNEEITQEQFNQIWKNSSEVAEDLNKRFGKLTLSMTEIQTIAEKMVGGNLSEGLKTFSAAAEAAEQSFSNLSTSQDAMVKLNWKAQMGFINDEESIAEFKSGVESLVAEAKSYVENSHYEATAAFTVIFGKKDSAVKIETLDATYEKINEELDTATKNLQDAVDKALSDGIISPKDKITVTIDGESVEMNEAEAIRVLQEKVSEITEKISNAKHEAKLQQLKIDFNMSDLTYESWIELQKALEEEMASKKTILEEAYTATLANLKLELGEGAINQEEYDTQVEEATKNYKAKVGEMEAEVAKFNFETLADTFGSDLKTALEEKNLSGTVAEQIKAVMGEIQLKEGEGVTWDVETISKYLNLNGMEEATKENLANIMGGIAESIPGIIAEEMEKQTAASTAPLPMAGLETAMKGGIEQSANAGAENADLSGTVSCVRNKLDASFYDFTIPETVGTNVKTGLEGAVTNGAESAEFTGDYGLAGKLDTSISSSITSDNFATTGSTAASAAQTAVTNAFDETTMSAKASIAVTPDPYLTQSSFTVDASGSGSGSGTVNLKIHGGGGGGFAEGGYVGYKQLSWLAEEGYPEMVIPFAPHRRSRALSLWQQAGEALGVGKHAAGGIVGGLLPSGGGTSSGVRKESTSGKNITVHMGGVTIEVNANGNSGDLISQIQAKKNEIANMISEMLSEALEESFDNMPLAAE